MENLTMFNRADGLTKVVLYVLLFPLLFQGPMLAWTWGGRDEFYTMLFKRIFLLLPSVAIIFACWLTIPCVLSIVVRQNRTIFVNKLLLTWWDLGRAIFNFWSGFFSAIAVLLGWILGFTRMLIIGLWLAIQDICLSPIRAVRGVSETALTPGEPWIAVLMTLLWCILEAGVFTFVTTSLVVDTLSGLTGSALDITTVRIVLYLMLLAFVVGSYAIVASLAEAIKSRNVQQIFLICLVEFVALIFEVMFLYREFVDALVPWFAQHAGPGFSMGVTTTLALAATIWAGIRGMTWFLFAGAGTPTIMAIIQRTGIKNGKAGSSGGKRDYFLYIKTAVDGIKKDIDWCHTRGEMLLSAFIVPPLQVVAACINFGTLLFNGNHIFDLPFKSYKDIMHTRELLKKA
jgi:hypothetical protein